MAIAGLLLLMAAAAVAHADADSLSAPPALVAEAPLAGPAEPVLRTRDGLESLRPALADGAYHIEPGPRPYLHRFSVSPAAGTLGTDQLYALRLAFSPNPWLGYESSLAHDPHHGVHAIFHTLSVILRRPMPGRLQPYLAAGYGMTVVLPGRAIAADAVTKNVLSAGGGLECFLRDDLALRYEMRQATAFGHPPNQTGMAAYDYLEQTLGLAFYRTLKP
jgi:hypothetical protein